MDKEEVLDGGEKMQLHPGAEENDVTQWPCISPVSLVPWYFTGKTPVERCPVAERSLGRTKCKAWSLCVCTGHTQREVGPGSVLYLGVRRHQ